MLPTALPRLATKRISILFIIRIINAPNWRNTMLCGFNRTESQSTRPFVPATFCKICSPVNWSPCENQVCSLGPLILAPVTYLIPFRGISRQMFLNIVLESYKNSRRPLWILHEEIAGISPDMIQVTVPPQYNNCSFDCFCQIKGVIWIRFQYDFSNFRYWNFTKTK